jgi:hypothetical protein
MHFNARKNPVAYLKETREYIDDLQRITLLRDKCRDTTEKASYDTLIHVMQEVLLFMNTIAEKDKRRA